ncbi:phospholipase D family protein [Mycolicibacterium septicum]|uniref:phospholipase D family protein n=1 Tax=Mycolicibacterium septicum TaxID=98668 RepID=UPI001AF66EA1|nr:phospholipase D family protein [Mycolicibacterium septicum]QRY53802.1 phospholipase D family protein [Mycolicibacterium septicum]
MTLTPETRVLLTDALRPPAGYRIEVAVGTTYSLNLTALLLAPLSFALFDRADAEDIKSLDPIRLLEAVRRYADHTTVFCQAGGIHVPSQYRSILTFVEDSVREAAPSQEGSLFHPKMWALRFVTEDQKHLHRVIVLSRNLTFDRSWDTALILDEQDDGAIEAAPAAKFVRQLPNLALRPLEKRRSDELQDLARTLEQVTLAPPAPFTGGELVSIEADGQRTWPFPDHGRHLLAISPFLSKGAVQQLAGVAEERTVVSRVESLEQVGSDALCGWQVNVLQRLAEVDPSEDVDTVTEAAPDGFFESHDGLHAKTFVVDIEQNQSMVVTGSANLTTASWTRNVEFDAVLTGPTSSCGVRAVLNGSAEAPGLTQILEEYSVTAEEGIADEAATTAFMLESFHRRLAAGRPVLHVETMDDERVAATLTLDVPVDQPGATTLRLASLGEGQAKTLDAQLDWTVSPVNVTPFVIVETTDGSGAAKVTRRCVLKAELTGAIDGRRQDAVFSILRSKADVLRYLVFLLGDPSYDALFAEVAGMGAERFADSDRPAHSNADVALFEPLVRAAGRDQDALARVASLVEELRELPNGTELVPDGFEELWDVVWQVHQEQHRA